MRKVWEKAPGLIEERIYLGGFEIFRKHDGPIGANTATLERETLHVMDDKQRIALVETRTLDTAGNDQAPRQLIRYQFGNHLGSASLELDEQAQIISYEEYAPYGSSTYQAVRSQTETPKRYRYTGKERDEESGLYYHGARYYAPWLGRWTSADPKSPQIEVNAYDYCRDRPNMTSDGGGMIDEEAKAVLHRLQQVVDAIPQKEFAHLNAAERGSRAHLILEFIVSLGQDSPARVANGVRLAAEVIVDPAGKIVAFGEPGQLGRAAKDFRTIDVALLKSPVSDVRQLIGKNASDVIQAGIDFKTGAAQLQRVKEMEALIKAPYVKAVQHGKLVETLEAKASKLSVPKQQPTVSAEAPPSSLSEYAEQHQATTEASVENSTVAANSLKKFGVTAAGALAGEQQQTPGTSGSSGHKPQRLGVLPEFQPTSPSASASEPKSWRNLWGLLDSSPDEPVQRPMTEQEAQQKMHQDLRNQY